ncbi:MAG: DUF1957 domain-containing protein, partial [Candidatus Brocadia sp.]|nr:DUF1957 domain-containing protein [Candidatus Brocadia sp.]
MEKGYLSFILHAHLPFVRHPEHTEFFEEDWLFEAITETYIPLIDVFSKLIEDGVDFRVTMSISPPLVSMLTDPLLQSRYIRYIEKRIEFAEKEIERTRHQPEFNRLALMYHGYFANARYIFAEKYRRNLVTAFKKFQEAGNVEIITCGATHGYFPLMNHNVNAMRAQI